VQRSMTVRWEPWPGNKAQRGVHRASYAANHFKALGRHARTGRHTPIGKSASITSNAGASFIRTRVPQERGFGNECDLVHSLHGAQTLNNHAFLTRAPRYVNDAVALASSEGVGLGCGAVAREQRRSPPMLADDMAAAINVQSRARDVAVNAPTCSVLRCSWLCAERVKDGDVL